MSLVPQGTDTSGMEQPDSDSTGPSKAKQILEGLGTLANTSPGACPTCGGKMDSSQINPGGFSAPGLSRK